jgi:hypothetical protein
MIELAKTEKEMRETKNPWPETMKELEEYITDLVKREHDYGTCISAMSLAATAAFNFVAHELRTNGFQAYCADFDFLRRSRGIKGGFLLLKAEDMVYPQYDLPEKLKKAMENWKPWVKEQAIEHLKEANGTHHEVVAHWKKLAGVA